jgi:hypothetical protein
MLKYLFICVTFVFAISLVNGQGGGITLNIPTEVRAGSEFIAVIGIPEGALHGIARLDIKLPNGFEAKAKRTENASFKFTDQRASFQWLKYPENQYVEISLSITTAPTVEGYFVIKGTSQYLKDNETVKSEIFPKIITVQPGDQTVEDLLAQQEQTKVVYNQFKSEGVACIRQVPYLLNDEIYVNLLVSKGDLNKYGKIQELIPVGYQVTNLKSYNAMFVYNEKQRTVKYMWMNMPDKPQFVVTYKLTPIEGETTNDPFIIHGTFTYNVNNKTLSVNVQERGIELVDP